MPVTDVVDPAAAVLDLAACVRDAGRLALSMFRTTVKQWEKDGASPVCEADIAVDRLLPDRLTAAYPGVGWLSEESPDDGSRLASRYVWIIDPIDGTRAFLAGLPDWTVSAALVEDGRPISPLVFLPRQLTSFSWHRPITAPRATAPQLWSRAVLRSRRRASPDRKVSFTDFLGRRSKSSYHAAHPFACAAARPRRAGNC